MSGVKNLSVYPPLQLEARVARSQIHEPFQYVYSTIAARYA
jgi:hypothetical protein